VLHVLDHSLPVGDGYAFRSGEIIRFERQAGWETLQVTSCKQGQAGALEETVDGLEFHRTPPSRALRNLPVLNQWGVVTTLRERLMDIVRRSDPDIIHVHSPCLNGMAAIPVARRFSVPVVYEVRSLWEDAAVDSGVCQQGDLRYRVSRAMETYVCRRVDHVITICEGLRRELAGRGVADSRITVVPNSVDLHRFARQGVYDQELAGALDLTRASTFGFIGSFFSFEGLDVLLRAVPLILRQEPQCRFILVGDGPELAALRALAAHLGIQKQVHFTGRVPHAEVERYYELIDVLIYPRLAKRVTELVTPLKPLEAMAKKKLIVASDVGGHREMVSPGWSGCLFAAGSEEALTETCLNLLAHRERWEGLRRRAREYVSQARSWETNVQLYTRLYQSLLPNHDLSRRMHA
jgi:PEP-CTERM/exosortase A-associated glycosyltransferase